METGDGDSDAGDGDSDGLSDVEIVGIAVGGVLLLLMALVMAFTVWCKCENAVAVS